MRINIFIRMIIAFSNFKGGVAKTTSVMNVGAGLARKGMRTLLIDIDPQFNLTTSLKVNSNVSNIYAVLCGNEEPKSINVYKNLDVIPSCIDLIRAEVELAGKFRREEILSRSLEKIKDAYDFVLIDCPPSIGTLSINALVASDLIFVPIEPEHLALTGYTVLNSTLDQIGLEIDKLIITKYDGRTVLHKNVVQSLEKHVSGKLFRTRIRKNIALAESTTMGKDIFSYSPSSNGAYDYMKLTEEILDYVEEEGFISKV